MSRIRLSRRDLLLGSLAASCTPKPNRALAKPELRWGVQAGDVDVSSAVVWSRASREAAFKVDWSLAPSFERAIRVEGARATAESDFTGKLRLTGLPSGTPIHYRVQFDDSEMLTGTFTTPPLDDRNVLLAWSADVTGQGWGFDPAHGGMPSFTALLERRPDLFIHVGDAIYADVPVQQHIGDWQSWLDPEGHYDYAARTLAELRTCWRYARYCDPVRAFSAAIPIVHVWDDHEVTDNWNPGAVPPQLMTNARRAMFEHTPTLRDPSQPMYRVVPWGPLVDVFLLDDRSWRTPATMLGDAQSEWLVGALAASRAVWKFVACGQPIAESVSGFDSAGALEWDTFANENGPPAEREIALAKVLSGIKAHGVKNVVWIVGDVHYGAATRFDPARAHYKDFLPFWELIAGPMHGRTFPANRLDDTFGPEREWLSAHPVGTPAAAEGSPWNGEQYMGLLAIDGKTRILTVTWIDARGRDRHKLVIHAE